VAIHGDVIVGFPTEDDAAWRRSLAFIESIGFAGIHVFRYSPRPGTPALRMTGHVEERTRRHRATELLAIAAAARARYARDHLGRVMTVLFETQLDDGRWIGHAEDHTLVAASAPGTASLENAVGRALVEAIDPAVPDRAVGRLLELDLPTRKLRGSLPVLASTSSGGTHGH
jgi:threonylcarbamoyladenosine tRNA methylthiotransferase MtaB